MVMFSSRDPPRDYRPGPSEASEFGVEVRGER
jgi:hypothetical protein